MITLTYENLHACGTSGRGFTKAQIKALGKRPVKGWLSSLIGTRVPFSQYKRFRELGLERRRYLRSHPKAEKVYRPKICVECKKNKTYLYLDVCEPCIWKSVQSQ